MTIFRFLTDMAFFIFTTGGIIFGSYHGLGKIYEAVKKETLIEVQKGLPKMEPFAEKMTGKKLKL